MSSSDQLSNSSNSPKSPVDSKSSLSHSGSSPSEFDLEIQHQPSKIVKIGPHALQESHPHSESVGIGNECLRNCVETCQTACGYRSGRNITLAKNITALGYYALESSHHENLHPHDSTALGYKAAMDTLGISNTAIGSHSLRFNIEGEHNTCAGAFSMSNSSRSDSNCFYGSESGRLLASGNHNTCSGFQSQYNLASVSFVTASGSQCLRNNQVDSNTGFGFQAGAKNEIGRGLTCIGYSALANSIDSNFCTAVGNQALENCGGQHNTGVGNWVLRCSGRESLGSHNSGFGSESLTCCEGSQNTGLGSLTLHDLISVTGTDNTASGYMSLTNLVDGHGNSCYGSGSGQDLKFGHGNTSVGFHSGPKKSQIESSLCLGAGAQATRDNELVLGSITYPLEMDEENHILFVTLNGKQYGIQLKEIIPS